MRKEIKLKARKTVLKNYKYFFVPILIYELLSIVNICIFNFGFNHFFGRNAFLKSTALFCLWLFIELVFLPALVIVNFRIGIWITDGKKADRLSIKSLLTGDNLLKIVLISLMPNIFQISDSLIKYFKDDIDNSVMYFLIRFVLLIVIFLSEYKFFVCNYYFAFNESSVKETLKCSFNTMKGKFFKYIIYDFSFLLWDLLFIIIGFAFIYLSYILDIELKYVQLAVPSGFGIMFFYRPYRFISNLLYSKKIIDDSKT